MQELFFTILFIIGISIWAYNKGKLLKYLFYEKTEPFKALRLFLYSLLGLAFVVVAAFGLFL